MDVQDIIRLPDPRHEARLTLREVVRDKDGTPHTWIRVELTGYGCPAGAADYSLLIGDTLSRFTRLSGDGLALRAYFDRPLPRARVVTLIYGRTALADFPMDIDMRAIARLDRSRLPKGVVDSLM